MRVVDPDHFGAAPAQITLKSKLQRRVDEVASPPVGREVLRFERSSDPRRQLSGLARPDENAASLFGMRLETVLQDDVRCLALENHHAQSSSVGETDGRIADFRRAFVASMATFIEVDAELVEREPEMGFEPITSALRKRYSTVESLGRRWPPRGRKTSR